ncbi:formyltransferase family protein [Roseomonas sp. 18066]|uniref:formyltransferase family protein n=1 Tax=Roseomonas sp. 18066 TaxID=2681412 RepID=UPI00190F6AD7|nr:formyltransferase family protein [Roseomonas sp. 18066]
MRPLRIALLTLESALSAGPVLDFARAHAGQIVLIGRSIPYRPAMGGMWGQMRAHWRRSGLGFLPFLLAGYGVPQTVGDIRRALGIGALSRFAHREKIPLEAVEDVNGPGFAAHLEKTHPDVIVSFHFDQILTAATLAQVPRGGINIHPGLLPRHRGPVPTFWAMQEKASFGVTVHRMVPRIDAGGILAQEGLALPAGTSAVAAARLLHHLGGRLATRILAEMAQGKGFSELVPPLLPYCPFPSAGALREAARGGHRLVGWDDWRQALIAPVG